MITVKPKGKNGINEVSIKIKEEPQAKHTYPQRKSNGNAEKEINFIRKNPIDAETLIQLFKNIDVYRDRAEASCTFYLKDIQITKEKAFITKERQIKCIS